MASFQIGAEVGPYTIKRLIKANTYTETYQVEARDGNDLFMKLFSHKRVPKKLINEKIGLIKEILYAEDIKHPNLPSFIDRNDVMTNDGKWSYYVTTFLQGELLSDTIYRETVIEEQKALSIYASLLDTLSYLHSKGYYHNDITPRNIMLTDNGVQLIDMGHLSEECWGVVPFDSSDLELLYLANETFTGLYGARSDIFAATAVLYTMLTGQPPWSCELDPELRRERQGFKLKEYRSKNPIDFSALSISEVSKSLLSKGLTLDGSKRPHDTEELLRIILSNDSSSEDFSFDGFELPERPRRRDRLNDDDAPSNTPTQSLDQANDDDGVEIKRGGGNGFADIAGMAPLKDYLQQRVIFVIKNNEMVEKYKLQSPNGMLLYGPPGCGKTFVAEKFAEETGFNFMLVKSSDLASIFVHGGQEKIARLFSKAEKNAPIVICFDEFDALVPDRSNPAAQHTAGEVNEFLSQLNNCNKRGIFVVATTNRPDKIDPAVLRTGRIDKMVYVPLPDDVARKEIIEIHLRERPCSDDIDTTRLAQLTEGYIASDLAFIVNESALVAAFTNSVITQAILEETIGTTRPSLRPETLSIYEKIKNKMEGAARRNYDTRPRIGFKK